MLAWDFPGPERHINESRVVFLYEESQVWWLMPAIPALKGLRKVGYCEFKSSLSHRVKLSQKQTLKQPPTEGLPRWHEENKPP